MKRLIAVQQGLKISKDKEGDKGRFKYRTAEDILERAKPLLEKQNLAVTLSDEIVEVGGRLFLKATATLWGVDGTNNMVSGYAELDQHTSQKWDDKNKSFYSVRSMSNEQCTGSASSYARKYALCGLFAIDNSESDPDAIFKSLITRIAEANNADDINALIEEIKTASEDEKKAFNAQVANLLLVYDKSEKKYINTQK